MRYIFHVFIALAITFALHSFGQPRCQEELFGHHRLSQPPREARLLFAGDVMQHMPQVYAARRTNGTFDYARVFEHVAPLLKESDMVVVNLETTLTPTARYSGYPCFRSPEVLAEALREAGVGVCMLANNHCCDAGAEGVRVTAAALDRCGIARTGVFVDSTDYRARHPLRLNAGGVDIALFNYTYGTNGIAIPRGIIVNLIDTVAMARDLRRVQELAVECVVVFMHWGDEYQRRPNAEQQRLAEFLRRHGADVIIGSHPHVVQPFEVDSAGVLFYSLGNFVSNQRDRYCDGGVMARVCITAQYDGRTHYRAHAIPVWVDRPSYRILPPQAAESIELGAHARIAYDRFMDDTRELLTP